MAVVAAPDIDSIPSIPAVYDPTQAEEVISNVRRNVIQSLPAVSRNETSSGLPRPAYRFKPQVTISVQDGTGDTYGKRLRKSLQQVRRTVDYVSSVLNYVEARIHQKGPREKSFPQPDLLYSAELYPPCYERGHVIDCVTNKLVRSAMNKIKCPIYTICWTPEGRRLLTGASSGEFTLWNGIAFNFETILQAHDCAVRSMVWSHNDQWMITADHDGFVKYWQTNMNNVKMYQAHKEAVRSISFCPTDAKFATASDDGTVRIWDFMKCHEEVILRGHGSDVRSVDWHPQKSLLASGSRDSQMPLKLWDPKSSNNPCLATLHDHKNGVMDVKWNRNGNWLASASRDHVVKVYDVRMMKEIQQFKGHKKEVISLAWHPIHESLFASGGSDGAIIFWRVGNEKEVGMMETAHEQTIWTLAWHPLGHILASGSNDNNTKFWARNKPGDAIEDFFGMGPGHFEQQDNSTMDHLYPAQSSSGQTASGGDSMAIPGMGLDRDVLDNVITRNNMPAGGGGGSMFSAESEGIPGLGGLEEGARPGPLPGGGIGGTYNLSNQSGSYYPNVIKKPFVKQAQREFEKIWNVAGGTLMNNDHLGRVPSSSAPTAVSSEPSSGGGSIPGLGGPPPPDMMGPPAGAGNLPGLGDGQSGPPAGGGDQGMIPGFGDVPPPQTTTGQQGMPGPPPFNPQGGPPPQFSGPPPDESYNGPAVGPGFSGNGPAPPHNAFNGPAGYPGGGGPPPAGQYASGPPGNSDFGPNNNFGPGPGYGQGPPVQNNFNSGPPPQNSEYQGEYGRGGPEFHRQQNFGGPGPGDFGPGRPPFREDFGQNNNRQFGGGGGDFDRRRDGPPPGWNARGGGDRRMDNDSRALFPRGGGGRRRDFDGPSRGGARGRDFNGPAPRGAFRGGGYNDRKRPYERDDGGDFNRGRGRGFRGGGRRGRR